MLTLNSKYMKISLGAYLNFFCLLVLIISITSCRLDGDTLVEGRIVDQHTGQPVGNGYVVVYGASKGANSYGYVAEGKADGGGRFGFTFEGSGDMVLRGFTDQGYYSDWQDGAVKLKSGRNNKGLKVKMMAPAWVRVKLVNVPPLETSPNIYVWGFSPDENGEIGVEFPYIKTDTTFVRRIIAHWERSIAWSIRAQDGTDTKYSTQVNAASLDTVEVRIEY